MHMSRICACGRAGAAAVHACLCITYACPPCQPSACHVRVLHASCTSALLPPSFIRVTYVVCVVTCWKLIFPFPFPFPFPGMGGAGGGVGAPVKFVGACLTIFGPADPMVKSVFCESFAVTFCMIKFLTLGG